LPGSTLGLQDPQSSNAPGTTVLQTQNARHHSANRPYRRHRTPIPATCSSPSAVTCHVTQV
ncbi:hypothetical protein K503DRAFT_771749, partial [Rhizopogon vinicolor AM-OR11-026]